MNLESLTELSDAEILARTKQLVARERTATAAVVAHLAEIERRKLYLQQGCRSLFTYCTQVLHLAEYAAYNRIAAARAAMKFPCVLTSLASGEAHLAAIGLIAPHLTPENHQELLAAVRHQSKRKVEELVVRLCPKPDAPEVVRKLPARAVLKTAKPPVASGEEIAESAPGLAFAAGVPEGPAHGVAPEAAGTPAATRRAEIVALAPERYKVQFTASAAAHEKLRRAQELLRHQIPNGDVAEIFDRALEVLVRDLEKEKFAATARPRRGSLAKVGTSRHIPAEVKRAVWERDQGRCTFMWDNQLRCTERGQLEFDHIRPFGDGGTAAADNVRLLCRSHNQFEAQQFFGVWRGEGGQSSMGHS